jgi:hypothetical protein
MTQRKTAGHNTKKPTEKEFLHPLQRTILLRLAISEPQTINETANAINGHYRSSWNAFNALKEKGLIKETGQKTHHGRDFPRYWLTELGIFIALREGAKSDAILRKTVQMYPEEKRLHFIVEIIPILDPNVLDPAYLALLENRQIGLSDKISIIFAQAQIGLSKDQMKRFNTVLRKYPEINQLTKDFLKNLRKNLEELSNTL